MVSINNKVIFWLLIIVCIVFISLGVTKNNRIEIKLASCIDGDTARFMVNGKEEKVRFLGIDAPESTNVVELFGIEASNYTCDMLREANSIYIEYDINSNRYDKYGRLLGWIFVDNNNLSELLLSKGYASVEYIYGNYKYIDNLCMAQNKAYEAGIGIWSIDGSNYIDNYCNRDKN